MELWEKERARKRKRREGAARQAEFEAKGETPALTAPNVRDSPPRHFRREAGNADACAARRLGFCIYDGASCSSLQVLVVVVCSPDTANQP